MVTIFALRLGINNTGGTSTDVNLKVRNFRVLLEITRIELLPMHQRLRGKRDGGEHRRKAQLSVHHRFTFTFALA